MDVDTVIDDTAKDASAEASRAAADEAAKDVREEAATGFAGEPDKETGNRTDNIPASGATGATSVPEPSVAGEMVVED